MEDNTNGHQQPAERYEIQVYQPSVVPKSKTYWKLAIMLTVLLVVAPVPGVRKYILRLLDPPRRLPANVYSLSGGLGFSIENNSQFPLFDLDCVLNPDDDGGYTYHVKMVEAKRQVEIWSGEFATKSGKRFNAATNKPVEMCISAKWNRETAYSCYSWE